MPTEREWARAQDRGWQWRNVQVCENGQMVDRLISVRTGEVTGFEPVTLPADAADYAAYMTTTVSNITNSNVGVGPNTEINELRRELDELKQRLNPSTPQAPRAINNQPVDGGRKIVMEDE